MVCASEMFSFGATSRNFLQEESESAKKAMSEYLISFILLSLLLYCINLWKKLKGYVNTKLNTSGLRRRSQVNARLILTAVSTRLRIRPCIFCKKQQVTTGYVKPYI